MSLYTFATDNFTTSDDRHRKPAIDKWQIARTLIFIVVAFAALVCVARHARADAPAQTILQHAAT